MQNEAVNVPASDLEQKSNETIDGVCFDAEKISLRGSYSDEISLYRAKKLWIETLMTSFLLENETDFQFTTSRDENSKFILTCEFKSACARYAFWRITNNQAPDAQYIIETAHIPVCSSRQDEILHAPDLRSINDAPYTPSNRARRNTSIQDMLKNLVDKIRGNKDAL